MLFLSLLGSARFGSIYYLYLHFRDKTTIDCSPKVDTMPRLHQVLRGVKIEHGKGGRVVHSQLPITPAILRRLRQVWIKDCKKIPFNNIMLWTACLVTFFSFCRSGEVTVEHENQYDASIHLSYGDLAVDNPSDPAAISMLIKKIKDRPRSERCQDLFRKSRRHLIPSSSHGGLSVSKGKQFRPSLSMGVRNPLVEVKLRKACKNSFRAGWSPSQGLHWAQLQNRCHNHGSSSWS